ncbi:cysteine desulfurase [candidate division WWE3 bacterium RIFOXYC1_FULL_39_7]|uniref:Cysteine desulfurase n=2 Tax=Katanobacteria TaxID=422282 RepID=A0A1F4X5A8_UNCKA|nr:MAG: cysteine desulfurase [candidate division WWE3 bacterium RIFOXYC1_FULL_39_7]OGC76852.1 MAG: cysteine desulfurase [candidate division WWE3 bacterium RIFOXYD1_FULL_39_9]
MEVNKIREDFPILRKKVNNHDLVYLDNAATSQKPARVVKAIEDFYFNYNANVHRGLHTLSEEASEMYENARKRVATFINAGHESEIIFTSGTTDSLNFVAQTWARKNLKKGDVILMTEAEHHSNLVPWQIVAEETGAEIEYVELGKDGDITLEDFKSKITPKVKLAAFFHCSNVLGITLPVKEISKLVKQNGGIVVVDGAQAVPHMSLNVQNLGCDFYAFSGHKMLGPMGIGVLWVSREILESLDPYKYGGGMIDLVEMKSSTWAISPEKFEAGTPNVAGAVGLAAAIDYLSEIGMDNVSSHEKELLTYAVQKLKEIDRVKFVGPADVSSRHGLISFYLDGIHAHDVASVLNSIGVAVRSGHHCAMPLHKKLDIPASVRASFYVYNTKVEVDKLIEGIRKSIEILG